MFIRLILLLLHKVTNNNSFLYLLSKKSGNFAVTNISNKEVTYETKENSRV
ncbi:hypothetical protein E18064_60063 [Elizabethkingia anophelis]|nr:hypothetical protein E18064_60063 [Elizabethkingia anophelis]